LIEETALRKTTSLDVLIGSRLRAHRLSRDLSQEELAESLGISFQQIQKYEKGSNRISASRLKEITDILQVPIATWFAEQKPSSKKAAEGGDAHAFITNVRAMRLLKSFSQIEDARTQNLIVDLCEKLVDKK
jgi:transcriptional regulator with XRE-family HTH domain